MSEQPKKKGLSTSIIVCIICAGILAAATALAIKSVVKTQQEEESRQQSMVDASESMLAASNDEETRLLNAVTDVCKKHNIAAYVKLNKNVHEPYSRKYSFEESTEDPIKYEIDISLQIDPPEKIKDWTKFYYFLDELESVQPAYPFIELSVKPYYVGEYVSGSGQSYELSYEFYISRQGLISVSDDRENHYIGLKTDNGLTPLSEILPYEGMPESLINSTKLGKATAVNYDPLKYSKFYNQTVARREGYHQYYWKIPYYAERFKYSDSLYAYYSVDVRNGAVESVWHYPEYETVPKQTSSSGGSSSGGSYRPSGNRPVTTTKKAYYDDDPYNARDFNDPEDFYDYYYDDFEDYEEAYDYFYEHNPD